MARPEWIEVGRVSRPHGVRGEVRILPSSDNPERFRTGSIVYARVERVGIAAPRPGEQIRLTIDSVRGSEDFPIVAFRQIAGREAAEALRGHVLEIPSSQLPELEEDEFYPFDLVGLEVRDPQGLRLGWVTDAVDTPAHALLAVVLDTTPQTSLESDAGQYVEPPVNPRREILIPFVREAVPIVAVPEGYLVIHPRFLVENEDRGEGEDRHTGLEPKNRE